MMTTAGSSGGALLDARLDAFDAELRAIRDRPETTAREESRFRDHRPGLMVACGGARRTAENPLGLRERQHESPDLARAFFARHYERATRLGIARLVWHMPCGWASDDNGMPGAAQSPAAMGERFAAWREETERFLHERPQASVGVYVSGQVPLDPGDPSRVGWEPYQHDRQDHRRRMIEGIVRPWVDAGVTELWFDHTAPADYRAQSLRLFDHLRGRYGLHTVKEAIPRLADGQLDAAAMLETASGALHRFMAGQLRQVTELPPRSDVHVLLSHHLSPGVQPPSPEDVARYRAMGATVWSMHEDFDELLQADAHAP